MNKLMLGMGMQATITSFMMCVGMRVNWSQQLIVAAFSYAAAAWLGD